MNNNITRRQFAIGSSAAIGTVAAGAAMANAQSENSQNNQIDPLTVPDGQKQFSY